MRRMCLQTFLIGAFISVMLVLSAAVALAANTPTAPHATSKHKKPTCPPGGVELAVYGPNEITPQTPTTYGWSAEDCSRTAFKHVTFKLTESPGTKETWKIPSLHPGQTRQEGFSLTLPDGSDPSTAGESLTYEAVAQNGKVLASGHTTVETAPSPNTPEKDKPGVYIDGSLTNLELNTPYTYHVTIIEPKTYEKVGVFLNGNHVVIPQLIANKPWEKDFTVKFVPPLYEDSMNVNLQVNHIVQQAKGSASLLLANNVYPISLAQGQNPMATPATPSEAPNLPL